MIVEDHPEIEEDDAKIPQPGNTFRQHNDTEIASETKQQITHRERGKQK